MGGRDTVAPPVPIRRPAPDRTRRPVPDRSAPTSVTAARSSRLHPGTPVFEPDGNDWIATFTVAAAAVPSSTTAVFLDVNCVTDRSVLTSGAMTPDPGGDSWTHSVRVPAGWRGAYCFIPSDAPITGPEPGEHERDWWIRFRRNALDVVEGATPDAPSQQLWTGDTPGGVLTSEVVTLDGIRRTVHTYVPPAPGRGTVVLFDGDEIRRHRVLAAFDHTGISPAQVLTVDHTSTDGRTVRESDLTANPRFRDDLLRLTGGPVVVGGCSYGGLAAMYFALTRPDVVVGAACLSPSMWWHDDHGRDIPTIAGADRGGTVPVHCETGSLEWLMLDEVASTTDRLAAAGHPVRSGTFAGGHDWVQWRERLPTLITGLLR
ncbi:MAG: alpha/beta hydrolase-fold protein [Rhodococcus sp. (in: high G+C Gram-positive bacteria)]|uniref:alpha/beta hydrolase-fold protein n=1 Tax=Rhodococcus sp. TaxID=1831 RepID=UPI003BB65311